MPAITYLESVTGYATARHSCYLCPVNHSGLVDTGVVIEGEGSLVLCRNCIYTLASVFDFEKPDVVQALREELSNTRTKLLSARETVEHLRQITTSQARYLIKEECQCRTPNSQQEPSSEAPSASTPSPDTSAPKSKATKPESKPSSTGSKPKT